MEVTDELLMAFTGQLGWLSAEHIYNGDSEWVDFTTVGKAFMLYVGLENGKVPFGMEEIGKLFVNPLYVKKVIDFKKEDGKILIRVHRPEEKKEENKDEKAE